MTNMKKILLAAVAILCLGTVAQAQHMESKWHGFYGTAEYTYEMAFNKVQLMSEEPFSPTLMGATFVGGFQWRHEAAVGLGFSYLTEPSGIFTQVPIWVEFRSYYKPNRVTPLTSVMLGYTMPMKTQGILPSGDYKAVFREGGINVGCIIGLRIAFTQSFGMDLNVGYQMLFCNELEVSDAQGPAYHDAVLLHNLKAGVGFTF